MVKILFLRKKYKWFVEREALKQGKPIGVFLNDLVEDWAKNNGFHEVDCTHNELGYKNMQGAGICKYCHICGEILEKGVRL